MRTPYDEVSLITLLAAMVAIDVWFAPPDPTMNSRIPFVGSDCPEAFCGAKRS